MAMTRKTISIPDAMEAWVKAQIASGRYANDSEYFRDLIRRDQERRDAEAELRHMLKEADEGGVSDRTLDQIWAEAERRNRDMRRRG